MSVSKDIFQRLKDGDPVGLDDLQYPKVQEVVSRTINLISELNASSRDVGQIRERLSAVIGTEIDDSTIV
ncbi:MAG: acetyltransferase, partial [Mucilaginibacter sp.]|nr:acetyltransferase [Mucilaginibacter sp.]